MNRLLLRASLRFYLRHPGQLVLAIAGIALGVAVYVGVDLANDSAARAFELAAGAVRGQATHRVLPIGEDLDEAVYRRLVLERRLVTAAPVLAGVVGIAGRPGLRVPLLGIDPVQESRVRAYSALRPGRGSADLARLIADPATILLPASLAAALGVDAGDTIRLVTSRGEVAVEVLGSTPEGTDGGAGEPPAIADIATAQELLGRVGKLSYVDLNLTEAEAAALRGAPPPGTVVVAAGEGDESFNALSSAFRTNLAAFGLLALVVGVFLIYGTMSFAVLQRRTTLGVLRSLGVARRELLATVIIEALGLALVATSLGLALGHWLASGLIELVLQSIGDLRFSAAVRPATPSPLIYVQGAAVGLGAALFAAAKPALDAARVEPTDAMRRSTLESNAARKARRAAVTALPVLLATALALALGPRELYMGFAALFGVLAAGALLTPAATLAFMRIVDTVARRHLGVAFSLAVRGVSGSLSRTAVATAALAVAIATVNGVGLMIQSFRLSLDDWLATTLTSDFYVSFDGAPGASANSVRDALRGVEGVAGFSMTRSVELPTAQGAIMLRAFRPGERGWGLNVTEGDRSTALGALARGDALFASERLLAARGLRVGDTLALPSPGGIEHLPIAAAFRDFNTAGYSAVVALDRYRRDWDDDGLSGVGIELRPGADRSDVGARLVRVLAPLGGDRIRSSESIRRLTLEIFDRTFEITEVLRALAAFVAFFGVLSALLAIELDRARELAVLRALGFSPRELAATLLGQTALLGCAAGLVAVPLGTGLAALLVHVINRRAFGWSMDLVVSAPPLLLGLVTAIGAALVAGAYPSWRASRSALGAALREE